MVKASAGNLNEQQLSLPQNKTHLRSPDIAGSSARDGSALATAIRTPMWLLLQNGSDPDQYAQQFPSDVDRATIAFGAAGYGCQPHATDEGVETYFSWLYDRLNTALAQDAPLLMHTIAFPGTEWDQSERHEHLSQKMDVYNISHHPTVIGRAIDAWLSDARQLLPNSVRRLDAILLAHSFGARALTAYLAVIAGGESVERGASNLAGYLAALARSSGFETIQMHPIWLSPAYALNMETARLLRLSVPLELVDSGVRHLPVGTLYARYQRITQKPFKWVANAVFKNPQLAGRLVGIDNTGRFMLDFAKFNDPHILLPQGRQLEIPLSVAPTLNRVVQQAAGWNPLVLSGEQDMLISNSAIDAIHGAPGQPDNYHVRVPNMTHIECLQDPATIAWLIAAHYRQGQIATAVTDNPPDNRPPVLDS